LPYAIELHEVRLDHNIGEICGEKFFGAKQFGTVMFSLGVAISLEVRQAAIGRAVGVAHHQDPFSPVQAYRHSDLFQNEILFEVIARRSQRLSSAGDNNHIGALDFLLLQKLSHSHADAVIEATQHSGIRHILAGRGIELEDFAHASLPFNFNRISVYFFRE
jgi:hypothetical protein